MVSVEAGIGKSVLLKHVGMPARALGIRTLATAGVESEAELAFAGLYQLVRPVFDLMQLST